MIYGSFELDPKKAEDPIITACLRLVRDLTISGRLVMKINYPVVTWELKEENCNERKRVENI